MWKVKKKIKVNFKDFFTWRGIYNIVLLYFEEEKNYEQKIIS